MPAFLVLIAVAMGVSARAATLSLPDDAAGSPGATVLVPLSATPANGILGLDITIAYNSSVVNVVNVTTTPISQGFTVTYNASSPNVLYISIFGTTPMSGSGAILNLHLQAIGSIGQSSPLTFSSAEINEGAIPAALDGGTFQICASTDTDVDGTLNCVDLDDDNDGVADGADCAPLDPTASHVPLEVASLSVTGAGSTTLTWSGQGTGFRYDVASALVATLSSSGGSGPAQCLLNDRATNSGSDARPRPGAGTGYYYIVRSQNVCGSSPYGFTSSGVPEVPTAACP